MSKDATFVDLSWLLFALHVIRSRQTDTAVSLPDQIGVGYTSLVLLEEGVKYVIQTIAKYGKLTKKTLKLLDYPVARGPSTPSFIRREMPSRMRTPRVSCMMVFPYLGPPNNSMEPTRPPAAKRV
jgi:hypothetical protein